MQSFFKSVCFELYGLVLTYGILSFAASLLTPRRRLQKYLPYILMISAVMIFVLNIVVLLQSPDYLDDSVEYSQLDRLIYILAIFARLGLKLGVLLVCFSDSLTRKLTALIEMQILSAIVIFPANFLTMLTIPLLQGGGLDVYTLDLYTLGIFDSYDTLLVFSVFACTITFLFLKLFSALFRRLLRRTDRRVYFSYPAALVSAAMLLALYYILMFNRLNMNRELLAPRSVVAFELALSAVCYLGAAALFLRLEHQARRARRAQANEQFAAQLTELSAARTDEALSICERNTSAFAESDMRRLTEALETRDAEKVKAVCGEFTQVCDELRRTAVCANPIVNAVAMVRLNEAAEQGVTLSVTCSLGENSPIDVGELGSIVANLLDNAITAAAKTEGRRAELRVHIVQGTLAIVCENDSPPVKIIDNRIRSTKDDIYLHGVGLRYIGELAAEHEGTLELLYEQARFRAAVYIPTEAENEE